ncbi:MAG: hypothetical protein IT195_07545 [Microthrixaceae bacterium]|nr:hypothetical protein [Microthrixaceae bacterium]
MEQLQVPPPRSVPPAGGAPGWLRRGAVILGWISAWLTTLVGIAVGYFAVGLGNCKWGFFGERGANSDAPAVTSGDLIAQLLAVGIATLPWWVVLIWPRQPQRRSQAAVVIALVSLFIVAAFLLPQFGRDMEAWESYCLS